MNEWRLGEVIVRREVWRGRPYAALPVIVVSDAPELLAVYLPEGAPFGFQGEVPMGRHPWADYGYWHGHGPLMLHRPGDAYSVFVFWKGDHRAFSQWYLNLQAPIRRTSIGFDSLDHTLDLWSSDGETWHWKDDEMLDIRVAQGHFTRSEAAAIRAEGVRLEAEMHEQGPWWDKAWAEWSPDPEWVAPTLREGWEFEPAVR